MELTNLDTYTGLLLISVGLTMYWIAKVGWKNFRPITATLTILQVILTIVSVVLKPNAGLYVGSCLLTLICSLIIAILANRYEG